MLSAVCLLLVVVLVIGADILGGLVALEVEVVVVG